MGLTRQSVQRTADRLQMEGIVTYLENPSHRRAKLVGLTARGRSVLDGITQGQVVWANDLGARLGEGSLRRALRGHPGVARDPGAGRWPPADGTDTRAVFRWPGPDSPPEPGRDPMSLSRVHLAAALLATLTIALFWIATVVVEATGGPATVAAVKSLIVVPGLFVLVPAIGVDDINFPLPSRRLLHR